MIPGIAASVITEKNKRSTNTAYATSNIKSQNENAIPSQSQNSLNNAYMFNGNNTVANSQSRLKETEQSSKYFKQITNFSSL
jgi:hypothetical protein